MNQPKDKRDASRGSVFSPLKIVFWPFIALWRFLYEHLFSYVFGAVKRDADRIYSIRFVWYGDSIYLHPMVWGSLLLFVVLQSNLVGPGWVLLIWFLLLVICFFTVIYNFNIVKATVLLVCVVAVLSLAYIADSEWEWNFLRAFSDHVKSLGASVEPGFYIVSAYVFAVIITFQIVWAWLFNRVEIDESYVYERRFMQSTTREPIFARGLKRETKDLLELIIMGAGDITHRTRNGYQTFKNVPGASLGLGTAIDAMLDYRRPGQIEMERRRRRRDADVGMEDGLPDDTAAGDQ